MGYISIKHLDFAPCKANPEINMPACIGVYSRLNNNKIIKKGNLIGVINKCTKVDNYVFLPIEEYNGIRVGLGWETLTILSLAVKELDSGKFIFDPEKYDLYAKDKKVELSFEFTDKENEVEE